MPAFVILGEAKNLVDSGTYTLDILRLAPQNDVVGQPLVPYFCFFLKRTITTAKMKHKIKKVPSS
jgi:hypothetical protein